MSTTNTTSFRSYFKLTRENPNFRNLWFGQIVSLFGDWFNLIASAALIAKLTESGMAIGGLFVVRMLAPFLISPFAGVWSDKFNRKTLLLLSDFLRGVTVIFFLFIREPGQIWMLYVLTAIQFALTGVFFPTRTAMLPEIVGKDNLGAANALSSATWSVMLAFGAAIGGFVAGYFGIYIAFGIDALTFLVSAYFIWQIKYVGNPPLAGQAAVNGIRATFSNYMIGIRYLWAHKDILNTALLKAAMALMMNGVFQVVQVKLAEEYFPIGENGGISLGIIYAVVGIGTGLGPIFARKFTGDNDRPMRYAIAISYAVVAIGVAMVSTLAAFWFVLIGVLFRGIGVGVNWVFSTQLLLQNIPPKVRGRIFSTEYAILTLANAIGAGIGGWLLDSSGLTMQSILLMLSMTVLLPGALWLWWTMRGRTE